MPYDPTFKGPTICECKHPKRDMLPPLYDTQSSLPGYFGGNNFMNCIVGCLGVPEDSTKSAFLNIIKKERGE
jgi:hypothetical protein